MHILQPLLCTRVISSHLNWRVLSRLQIRVQSCPTIPETAGGGKNFIRRKTTMTNKPRKFKPEYEKDKVDPDFVLIYDSHMKNYTFWGQVCIYALTIPPMVISSGILWIYRHDIPLNISIDNPHPTTVAMAYILFGSLFMLFINTVCRRYITRIYGVPYTNDYIAITHNWWMKRQKLKFSLEDAKPKKITYFSVFGGNLQINNKPFFVSSADFRLPAYFNTLMRYDQFVYEGTRKSNPRSRRF